MKWILSLMHRVSHERRILEWMCARPGYHLIGEMAGDAGMGTPRELIESCNRLVRKGLLRKRRDRVLWCQYAANGRRRAAPVTWRNSLVNS